MTASCQDDRIDEYLLGRLSAEDIAAFEEHYFNCPACFEELKIRAEVLSVIQTKGRDLFPAAAQPGRIRIRPKNPVLKPVWWWTAAAGAAAVIVGILLLARPPQTPPVFTLSGDDTVRGQALGLISPRGDVALPPLYLEWAPLAEGTEYSVSLFDRERLWSETTRESRIRLPEEIRGRMLPGRTYSWQVKAFSPEGALTALSSRLPFKIAGPD